MASKKEIKPLLRPLIDPINKEDVIAENSHEISDSQNANQMDESEFIHVPLGLSSFKEKQNLLNASLEPNLKFGIMSFQKIENTFMDNCNQLLRDSKIKDPKKRDISKKI